MIVEEGFSVERMKELASVLEPDPRNLAFVRVDRQSGVATQLTIADHHEIVSRIELHPTVPDDIRSSFETVKTLVLYGWLYYPFFAMSHIYTALTVEMALRIRLPKSSKDRRGLADLFKEAESQGLIPNSGFNVEPFRRLRNSFVHAKSQTILPPGYAIDMLSISAKLLNTLWPKP